MLAIFLFRLHYVKLHVFALYNFTIGYTVMCHVFVGRQKRKKKRIVNGIAF